MLKFGIIGYGKIGRLRHRVLSELNLGDVVAVSDPYIDPGSLETNIKYFKEYHDLLSEDLDAVIIATTNDVTAMATIAALKAGRHVFCEKPPGRNLSEVLKVKTASLKAQNMRLKYGFNHREHYSVKEAIKIIENGRMGRLMWARGFYGKSGGEDFEQEWRSNPAVAGGGILLDQGIHLLDLLNYFFKGFSEVKSFISKSFWEIPLEDNAFAILKNKSEQYAIFHSSSTQWKHLFRLELFFSDGYMILSGLLTGSRSYGRETLTVAKRNFQDGGAPQEEKIYFDEDRSWYFEMEDFCQAIEQDRPITQGSIDHAIAAMELVERIYSADDYSE